MIEVCVGGEGGGTSMLNLLSPQEYVRGSFTYIRIVVFFLWCIFVDSECDKRQL